MNLGLQYSHATEPDKVYVLQQVCMQSTGGYCAMQVNLGHVKWLM